MVRTESQEAAQEWRDRRARPRPHMEARVKGQSRHGNGGEGGH